MSLAAVQNGLSYGGSATRVVCATESVRMPCGVHPVFSPCPAYGASEVSTVCGNLVVMVSG